MLGGPVQLLANSPVVRPMQLKEPDVPQRVMRSAACEHQNIFNTMCIDCVNVISRSEALAARALHTAVKKGLHLTTYGTRLNEHDVALQMF